MADPVSAGLSAGASILGAVGSIAGGSNAASVLRQNAAIDLAQGNAAADQTRRQSELRVGNAIADYGAAGIDPNSGSALAMRSQLAGQGELSAQDQLYNARLKAMGLDYQATETEDAADIGAAGTLLSGAGQLARNSGTPNLTDWITGKSTMSPSGAVGG